jgi:hypothetical protein
MSRFQLQYFLALFLAGADSSSWKKDYPYGRTQPVHFQLLAWLPVVVVDDWFHFSIS